MSTDERLHDESWKGLASDADSAPLSREREEELARRLADHEANPGDVVPWDVVETEARARFRR